MSYSSLISLHKTELCDARGILINKDLLAKTKELYTEGALEFWSCGQFYVGDVKRMALTLSTLPDGNYRCIPSLYIDFR
jgi:hypothetical protein